MEEILIAPTKRWRKRGVNLNLINERKKIIISMKIAWYTNRKIHRQINHLWIQRDWGRISFRTVQMTIADYFSKYPVNLKELELIDIWLREWEFARQEKELERMSLYINNRPKEEWKWIEYLIELRKVFRLRQVLINARGWNATRKKRKDFKYTDEFMGNAVKNTVIHDDPSKPYVDLATPEQKAARQKVIEIIEKHLEEAYVECPDD